MALQVWLPLNGDLHNQGLNQNVTATNHGATMNDSGKIGKCYSFDGESSYITLNNSNFLQGLSQFSIAFWCNPITSIACLFQIKSSQKVVQFGIWNDGNGFSFRDSQHSRLTEVSFESAIANNWNHFAFVYNSGSWTVYKNGIKSGNGFTYNDFATTNSDLSVFNIGRTVTTTSTTYYTGKINDFRIYDHALSPKEVEDISKALVLHYPLNDSLINPNNLFAGTAFTPEDQANFVGNSSTDWTKYFRYYNGNAGLHIFDNGVDTIKLSVKGNIGIAFVRKATEIGLDSSKYYTISCEAKCSQSGAQLSIGLSYYTNGNAWTWRGGDNKKSFTEVDEWQTFTLTFKPDSNTQYICYCFTVYGTNGSTDTFSIRHCKLEQGSTATAWFNDIIYDVSGYGNNGTIIGTASAAIGSPRYNGAIYMNNTSTANHIECDKVINIPTDGITVSFWAYTDKTNSYVLYIDQNMSFAVSSGGTAFYVCRTSSAGFPKTEFKTGQWNHVVLIRNEDTYKAYINGKSIARNQSNNNWTHQVANIYLFNRKYNNNYAANAYMSDFRMYATELTEDQIQELYQTSMLVDASGNIIPRGLEEV